MTFVFFGIGIGVLFGVATGLLRVRSPVLMLLSLGALLTAGTALSGMVLHAHPGVIATAVFGSVAASQLAYVALSLTHSPLLTSRGSAAATRWRRVWPFAGLMLAVLVTGVWIAALGYALVRLIR
jgi:hypothetical protein